MQELKLIPLSELFDMLVEQTTKYLGMVNMHGSREDLQICRELMAAIQIEIEHRKAKKNIDSPLIVPSQDQSSLESAS